ncbi:hypothetical protein PFISCL1PPCAC_16873, partial [Pristionchus fissidentatus]
NSLEYEAFEEEKGAGLNFEYIRSFVCHEIDWQINPPTGDSNKFDFDPKNLCPLDQLQNATRCLLWNARSKCLKQLDDLLKLKG